MSTDLVKITENSVLPLLSPKMKDLVELIGETRLKKETSFAIQAVNANSYLAQATPQSVAKAIWNVAITGLSLNPVLKLAYVTPRSVGGVVEAILMPSYQGLVKLITDTGSVVNVYAHPVFEGDGFDVTLGMTTEIYHKPKYKSTKLTHVYAVATLKDGSKQVEVMSADEVNLIRERSDGWKAFKSGKAKSAIWETDYPEMARKTVTKRITKYLPKTEQWEKLAEAIDIDNQDYPATMNQEQYIQTLIESSAYGTPQRDEMERELNGGISSARANEMILDLQNNQLDPIAAGLNYSTTDAKRKIANEIPDAA